MTTPLGNSPHGCQSPPGHQPQQQNTFPSSHVTWSQVYEQPVVAGRGRGGRGRAPCEIIAPEYMYKKVRSHSMVFGEDYLFYTFPAKCPRPVVFFTLIAK